MKKEMLALWLPLSAILCSCDPGATTTVYFENDTDLEVKFQAFGTLNEYDNPVSFEELTIGPHSRVEVGINYGFNGCIESDASYLLTDCTDSLRIAFVDCGLIYYRDRVSGQLHSPYSSDSFHLENYETEWYSHTADAVYVITEEDYIRAK